MAARPLTVSGSAPKASRSAAKNTAKPAARKSTPLPEGEDEEIDFDSVETKPKGKGATKVATPAAKPAPKASKSAKDKGGSVTLTFVLEKETAGAGQYCEVDADGKKLGIKEACMGKPYLRKDHVGGVLPKKFSAVITW